jgi:multimeric flavodoxin WrbA
MNQVSVFCCSHRPGGNTEAAARGVVGDLQQAGMECELLSLADYDVRPCEACNACLAHPRYECRLAGEDDAEFLFERFLTAPAVVLASPIYFYHLPSRLKTLIDRGQRFWAAHEKNDPAILGLPSRPAYVILAAARQRGAAIFDGALLTLKRFFFYFNIELAGAATLRGLDEPGDFAADAAAQDAVRNLSRKAVQDSGPGVRL